MTIKEMVISHLSRSYISDMHARAIFGELCRVFPEVEESGGWEVDEHDRTATANRRIIQVADVFAKRYLKEKCPEHFMTPDDKEFAGKDWGRK